MTFTLVAHKPISGSTLRCNTPAIITVAIVPLVGWVAELHRVVRPRRAIGHPQMKRGFQYEMGITDSNAPGYRVDTGR